MKKIALLTTSYPHGTGEQFIESEIGYWSEVSGVECELTIFPSSISNEKSRSVPTNIIVNNVLAKKKSYPEKAKALLKVLFRAEFYREVGYLFREKKLCFLTLKQALIELSLTIHYADSIAPYLRKNEIKTIYSYWNNYKAYAGVLLKHSGVVDKVVSRCHRYEVYAERKPLSYMPLKWQFVNDFDALFVISNSQISYFKNTYGANAGNLSLSRLGVEIPKNKSLVSPHNHLNILSVSFCTTVKRVGFIIDAIAVFHKLNPAIDVSWTHIGDGPLREWLENYASSQLQGVNCSFLGLLSNDDVKKYYKDNKVDLFINASESEGVPVSIMEAMSYGVPVIAPDVGGISELLSSKASYLVPSNADIKGFSNAISCLKQTCKSKAERDICTSKVEVEFNQKINYPDFIRRVLDI